MHEDLTFPEDPEELRELFEGLNPIKFYKSSESEENFYRPLREEPAEPDVSHGYLVGSSADSGPRNVPFTPTPVTSTVYVGIRHIFDGPNVSQVPKVMGPTEYDGLPSVRVQGISSHATEQGRLEKVVRAAVEGETTWPGVQQVLSSTLHPDNYEVKPHVDYSMLP